MEKIFTERELVVLDCLVGIRYNENFIKQILIDKKETWTDEDREEYETLKTLNDELNHIKDKLKSLREGV